ncbi:MAG: 3-phosphoglycerate dehydrogenase [Bacteroidetes bacterium]|nr:3-phosphoglycerate dehydrogenase [Bacteroidota bacterium]
MTKILVATEKPFAKIAIEGIKKTITEAGYDIALLENYTDPKDLLQAVADADALIIRSDKATKEVIEAGRNLKLIVRAGAGYDNIDLAAATAKGIVAMNTPGQNSNAVAELTFGMLIFMARGNFKGGSGTELKGKKIGIHAYGNVGKNVARIAKGFDMDVYAFDPFVPREVIEKDGIKGVDSVEELYSTCHYISLNIPATEKTKNSINLELLSKMPTGATVINTARKEVINEAELKQVFVNRPDFKYISDIMPDCHQDLLQFENRYYCTPKKQGAETSEANINAGLAAANQIVKFFKDGDKTFQVNK